MKTVTPKQAVHKERLGPKCYGFWRYDVFPFVLGAPGRVITLVSPSNYRLGCFVPDGYAGTAFSNPFTCSLKEGKQIHKELEQLTTVYNIMMETTKASFQKRLEEVAPFFNKISKSEMI